MPWPDPVTPLQALRTVGSVSDLPARAGKKITRRIITGKFCNFLASFYDFANVSIPTIAGGDYVGQANALRIPLFL